MKKKVFATLLAVSMIASMVPAAVSVQAADGDSIRLVNGKIEVDAQLKKLAEMYEKETGTKVEIESMGGGIDIQGTLKGYYQSDNMPDIFVNGSGADFANWTDMLVDMSDQEWASDTDAAYVDESQGTIGFPYTTEAIGLAYNKDILDKAGIDPSTLTSPDAIKEAFETIDSKKDELGLTYIFISHDLSVVKYISDRIIIMYLGRIMEIGDAKEIYANPAHPYTKALFSAIPPVSPYEKKETIELKGEIPSPLNMPPGCPFGNRCPFCTDVCKQSVPELKAIGDNHEVACVRYQKGEIS